MGLLSRFWRNVNRFFVFYTIPKQYLNQICVLTQYVNCTYQNTQIERAIHFMLYYTPIILTSTFTTDKVSTNSRWATWTLFTRWREHDDQIWLNKCCNSKRRRSYRNQCVTNKSRIPPILKLYMLNGYRKTKLTCYILTSWSNKCDIQCYFYICKENKIYGQSRLTGIVN